MLCPIAIRIGAAATLDDASGVRSVTVADGMPIDFIQRPVMVSQSSGTTFASARVGVGLLVGSILIRTTSTIMDTPLTVGPKPLGAVEPLMYAAAASVAVAVALLAALPAVRRATSIQPMIAMRSE